MYRGKKPEPPVKHDEQSVESANPLEKFYSLPDMRERGSEIDMKPVYSLSLSQFKDQPLFGDYQFKPAPYNLRWVTGYNHKVGVINMNDRGSTIAFYAASNCGILYNWTTNQMRILQGHRHMLTCIAADAQARWLVTADSGAENIIIIWDARDCFPQRTIFSPHGSTRLARVAMSADAKYLLTLGYQDKAHISWWIWSLGKQEPHAVLEVDVPKDSIIAMDFNPHRTEQFLLLTKQDIWIGDASKIFVMERGLWRETADYQLKIRAPKKLLFFDVGKLTCFAFVAKTSQVLVATTRGAVLIYGYTINYKTDVDSSNLDKFRYVKSVKIEKHRINVIKSIDDVIITGSNKGEIHFYDDQLKLLYWVHGFVVDSVKVLSFNVLPRSYIVLDPKCNKRCPCWEQVVTTVDKETGAINQKLLKKELPSDSTRGARPFLVRDFLICTEHQGIAFVDFAIEKLHTILDYDISPVFALSIHPEKPFACLGYGAGSVELIDFIKHKLVHRLDLRQHYKVIIPPDDHSINCNYQVIVPELSVSCLKYSPSGLHLACGLTSGQILFLDPTTLDILTQTPFHDTEHAIKEFNYSEDSLTLAYSDHGKTIGVYKYDCETLLWRFIGKHRAHYKEVTAVFFLPKKNDDGEYKLLSLGADRVMVEYDIGASTDNDYLEMNSLDRIEQTALPLGGVPWPTPKEVNPEECRTDLPLILMANDEYKYKIINYTTTMTLATVLGPRYEHPVCKLQLISKKEGDEVLQYMIFATKNIIGLQKLPLDGNPWKHVAQLGHPKQITVMCYREDIEYLFTIGAQDTCMCQWALNNRSVETTTVMGGGDLDPYYCVIENGRPGWLFCEVRDLFYYIQILCQGTFSPAMRRVKDFIPIDSLPDLMRALGFFPSEYEVENLLVEAKYKVYQSHQSTEVDFEGFVKLYLNHRPAFCEGFKRVRNAFIKFTSAEEDYTIEREDFVRLLGRYGENFSLELSWYLLSILSGHSFEDRAAMSEEDFNFLPEYIDFNYLATTIFGIQDSVEASESSLGDSKVSETTGSFSLDSEEK